MWLKYTFDMGKSWHWKVFSKWYSLFGFIVDADINLSNDEIIFSLYFCKIIWWFAFSANKLSKIFDEFESFVKFSLILIIIFSLLSSKNF